MDYYQLLGVSSDATPDQIKKAFRQIARECHPDVTGDDPAAAERFKDARKAYETLIDPDLRQRYDRRGQRKFTKGSFFEQFYRQAGGDPSQGFGGGDGQSPLGAKTGAKPRARGAHDAGGTPGAGRKAMKNPANELDLEDLFSTFGFGAGQGGPPPDRGSGGAQSGPQASTGPSFTSSGRASPPTPGGDVTVDVEVPALVARDGGSVTVVYHRMQRADAWRPGSPDPGVVRIQDITDVRVIPGTRDGEVLRERGLGDAGAHGGTYGDLLVRLRVVGRAPPPEWSREPDPPPRPRPEPESWRRGGGTADERLAPDEEPAGEVTLEISVVEAMLGGRVEVSLGGDRRVRLSVPPGTSSGVRMRLKGKAANGGDLFVVTRIVVPRELDPESRRLIEEFALLNPGNPRNGDG
jgi:curved DNA-binding protein